jgi:hypothetical protein
MFNKRHKETISKLDELIKGVDNLAKAISELASQQVSTEDSHIKAIDQVCKVSDSIVKQLKETKKVDKKLTKAINQIYEEDDCGGECGCGNHGMPLGMNMGNIMKNLVKEREIGNTLIQSIKDNDFFKMFRGNPDEEDKMAEQVGAKPMFSLDIRKALTYIGDPDGNPVLGSEGIVNLLRKAIAKGKDNAHIHKDDKDIDKILETIDKAEKDFKDLQN